MPSAFSTFVTGRPERTGTGTDPGARNPTLVDHAAGGVAARPELDRAERELATVAVLAAPGGAERRLATHTRAALRHGHAASELLAPCEHVALSAGFPRALTAPAVIDEVLTDSGSPRPAEPRPVRLHDHDTVVARRGDDGPPAVLVHSPPADALDGFLAAS